MSKPVIELSEDGYKIRLNAKRVTTVIVSDEASDTFEKYVGLGSDFCEAMLDKFEEWNRSKIPFSFTNDGNAKIIYYVEADNGSLQVTVIK